MNLFRPEQAKNLVINSRMEKAFKGLTHGYSCNFFIVENDIWAISEAEAWINMVLKKGGAPSVDLSKLHHAGVPVSNGGVSSGVVPFARAMNYCMESWFKPGKNSAGLIGLDITHPDLKAFLDMSLTKASKVIYFTQGEKIPKDALAAFLAAYNTQSNLFAYKRESREWGTNLCTEIKMKHKHTCVLGTHDLAQYHSLEDLCNNFLGNLYEATYELIKLNASIETMYRGERAYDFVVTDNPENNHVGLSVIGLATLLSQLGITYQEFVDSSTADAKYLWLILTNAYRRVATYVRHRYPHILRVFTQAPTVNSHTYVTTKDGLAVSAELSPVTGLRTTVIQNNKPVERVLQLVLSKDKGNRVLEHAATTETKYDVSWETHFDLFVKWQYMLDNTRLAQNISYETYRFEGETFTEADFYMWYDGNLNSLYYLRKLSNVSQYQNDIKFDNQEIAIGSDLEDLFSSCTLDQNDEDCGCHG